MAAVFTVYFDGQFWVGLLESEDEGGLVVARHVFGSEPNNGELLDFMLNDFAKLRRLATPLRSQGTAVAPTSRVLNPKRAQREALREQSRPVSTRAQAAFAAALKASASDAKSLSREERREDAVRRFELRVEKKKKKRAGH